MAIIVFILILGLLVLVHEFGHFIVAKKAGILVEEFGFGFPPKLFGVKIGETVYSLNLIPLGGFVKVFGEEYGEFDKKNPDDKLKKRAFAYKKPFSKASVVVAGVICNFILGWGLISYLFTQGLPTPANFITVEKVQPASPALFSGIKEKDHLIKLIKDQSIYNLRSVDDLSVYAKKFGDQEIILVVDRNNQGLSLKVTPRKNPPKGQGALGIIISQGYIDKKYPWYQAPIFGLVEAGKLTAKIVQELGKTFFTFVSFKKAAVDVSGPIGIARFTGQAIKLGKNAVLELLALLSLNLAVINILPFPALDGGRLVFIIYEWITKKRFNKTVEKYLNLAGFAILITLAILISINDIMKIYK